MKFRAKGLIRVTHRFDVEFECADAEDAHGEAQGVVEMEFGNYDSIEFDVIEQIQDAQEG